MAFIKEPTGDEVMAAMKPQPELVPIGCGASITDTEALARDRERAGRYMEPLSELVGRSESIHKSTEYRVVHE